MAFFGVTPLHPEQSRFSVSYDSAEVTLSVLNDDGTNWFNIKEVGNNVTLTKVTLKPGNRAAAPVEEIVEIVAGPDTVGSAEVDI